MIGYISLFVLTAIAVYWYWLRNHYLKTRAELYRTELHNRDFKTYGSASLALLCGNLESASSSVRALLSLETWHYYTVAKGELTARQACVAQLEKVERSLKESLSKKRLLELKKWAENAKKMDHSADLLYSRLNILDSINDQLAGYKK